MNDVVDANSLIVSVNYPQFSGGFGPFRGEINMGSKGKSRWAGRAEVKAEERQRRRQEMKDEINREKAERVANDRGYTATHPIPIKYD